MIKRLTPNLWLCAIVMGAATAACLPAYAQQSASGDYLRAAQVVDKYILEGIRAKGITSSPVTSDMEFVRRAFLDVVGYTPTFDQVTKFVQDSRPNKREMWINALLDNQYLSEDYIENWGDRFTTLIVGRRNDRNAGVSRPTMKTWMMDALRQNRGWDQIVRSILTAEGSNDENGAVNFFAKYGPQVKDTSAAVSRIFLGVRISCAQCHDHKFEKWKQEDFWSLASFFTSTQQRPVRPRDRTELPYFIVKDNPFSGQLSAVIDDGPKKNQRVSARTYLDGQPIDMGNMKDPREALADWVTSPRNPYFAPAIVNRIWGELFGRGIVHPVDDFGDTPEKLPSHPELLNYLSEDLIAHNYDLKYLLRVLLNSQAYQLSAVMTPTETKAKQAGDNEGLAKAKETAEKSFARARFRPLSPEQIFRSVVKAAGGGTENADPQQRVRREQERSSYLSRFVTLLDNDEGMEQLDFEATIPQALTMINGDLLNARIGSSTGFLAELFDPNTVRRMGLNTAKRVEYIYLQAVGRAPTREEGQVIGNLIRKRLSDASVEARLGTSGRNGGSGPGQRPGAPARLDATAIEREILQDLLWALLNSSEFMFNR